MTNEIKIDHGIKPPTMKARGKYPWREMKKGDSFFSEAPFMGGVAQAASLRLGNGCKFITKRVIENGVKGTRVWRVS